MSVLGYVTMKLFLVAIKFFWNNLEVIQNLWLKLTSINFLQTHWIIHRIFCLLKWWINSNDSMKLWRRWEIQEESRWDSRIWVTSVQILSWSSSTLHVENKSRAMDKICNKRMSLIFLVFDYHCPWIKHSFCSGCLIIRKSWIQQAFQ